MDKQYRVLVTLVRTDSPDNYEWKCPRCYNPLVNLVNADFRAMSDVFDMTNTDTAAIGVRCNGRLHTGGHCRIMYYFTLRGLNG